MKELSDKQFDELLKQKAESFNYDFDESAWNKMEQKLRRRDRVVFIRNSSFVVLILMLCGGAYLLFDNNVVKDQQNKLAKHPKNIGRKTKSADMNTSVSVTTRTESGEKPSVNTDFTDSEPRVKTNIPLRAIKNHEAFTKNNVFVYSSVPQDPQPMNSDSSVVIAQSSAPPVTTTEPELVTQGNPNAASIDSIQTANDKAIPKRRKLTFSVTAMAGPDFSAIKSFEGSKGTLNFGLLLNASISDRITLSSGVKYGPKNYSANGYSYHMQNSSRASKVEGIDASCNILEIPLQVSYSLVKTGNKQIRVASGLSSYLMLREEYNFRYNHYSGYKDYLLVKNNENQHYLSVLTLSGSYEIRPKPSGIRVAIEPYLKLPLGGVGEGNVRLKSSGISLNLTYDISKKIK